MEFNPQTTFFAALNEIMKTDVAAVALTQEEIFFIANDLVPKDQRIRYGAYLRFIDSLDDYGEPTIDHEKAELFLEIYDYVKAQQAKQRLTMLNGIMAAEKDWRRFQWLLQWQEKQERQNNAQARLLAKAQKERQQALDAVAKFSELLPEEQPKTSPTDASSPATQNNNPVAEPKHYANYYEQQRELGKVG